MINRLAEKWRHFREKGKNFFFWLSHKCVLPLRYNIIVKGAECLDPKKGGVNHSILFLSNHSSHLDGTILVTALLRQNISLNVWALDLTFKIPYLRWVARHKETVKVVKVPNIPETRSEKHSSRLHKLVTRTADGINKGENFLIFPSGKVKETPIESIEGKSAIPLIILQCPNVHVILIRISGMWGSHFSCATKAEKRWATRTIKTRDMFWESLKMILLNGIFFIPKRTVIVELIPVGDDFPRYGTRLEINRYLEEKFNESWGERGEPLHRVPNYFWKEEYPEYEYVLKSYSFNLNHVPKPFRNAIVKMVADKADMDVKDVNFDMHLGRDLGLDSIDLVELLAEIEKTYNVSPMVPEDLTTVGHLIAIAAKIPIACEVQSGTFHEPKK